MCVSDTINFPSHPYFSRDSAFLTTRNHPSDLQACPQAGGVVGELPVWGSSFLPDVPSSRGFLGVFLILPIEHVCVIGSNLGRTPQEGGWALCSQAWFTLWKLSVVATVRGQLCRDTEQRGTRLVHNPLSLPLFFKASPACWPMASTRLPTLCTM